MGLADQIAPPPPLTGNAYAQDLPQIPPAWERALARFGASALMPRLFPDALIDNFTRTKRQEIDTLAAMDAQDVLHAVSGQSVTRGSPKAAVAQGSAAPCVRSEPVFFGQERQIILSVAHALVAAHAELHVLSACPPVRPIRLPSGMTAE